ncbi:hypothetical protein [Nocardia abscessus]|nr:hypothetical protein [Nocardia abscessus]
MTFTVRIPEKEHEMLTSLAALRKQSVAQLAREILRDGVRRLLDPEEIEKRMAEQRAVLLEAAAQMRGEK